MIFVTVGTHEQQFNRLIKEVDKLKGNGKIAEDVFIQTGYSDYTPQHCSWKEMLDYNEMERCLDEAKVVISHGGPSTFMAVITKGKRPIVVPRLKKYGEHVNDHQLDFAIFLKDEGYTLDVVEDCSNLFLCIENNLNSKVPITGRTERFVNSFEELISELVK